MRTKVVQPVTNYERFTMRAGSLVHRIVRWLSVDDDKRRGYLPTWTSRAIGTDSRGSERCAIAGRKNTSVEGCHIIYSKNDNRQAVRGETMWVPPNDPVDRVRTKTIFRRMSWSGTGGNGGGLRGTEIAAAALSAAVGYGNALPDD